jgi:putative oxidoreductase
MKVKSMLFGADGDGNPGLLVLRVFAGAAMMTHGFPKLFGGLEGFTQYVGSLGIPAPSLLAFLAAFSESLGALFVVLGLLTRPASALLGVTMAVAAFVAHGADPFAKKELACLYLAVCVLFVLKGAGKWSLDRVVTRI